jgi:hypothetical protein
VYVILRVVDNLNTILTPILPHTAQVLHEYVGYERQLFGTQHVDEYQEEARTHDALSYDHRAPLAPGRRVNCRQGRRCGSRRRSSRSWTRGWSRRRMRGWKAVLCS